MSRDEQIEEIAKVIKSSLDGLGSGNFNFTGDEISTMFAKALYTAGYRKASEVARNIFGNLRMLGHIDFDGNMCIRKDSFEKLKKKYTEGEG